jgi:hypothetical protein
VVSKPSDGASGGTALYVGHDHAATLFHGVLFMIVQNDPGSDVLQHQAAWIRRMKAEAPEGSAFLVVLRSDVPPPPDTARALIKRVFQEFSKVVVAGAMVVEGKGFLGSALRSVLTMLSMAARPSYPLKVFSSVPEACNWLYERLPPGRRFDAMQLLTAVEDTRAAYKAGKLVVAG